MPTARFTNDSILHSQIGHYHLCELVGAGGVAMVYRAEHVQHPEDQVAVKVMRPERAAERDQVKAFRAEFDLLNSLDHPGIPKVRRMGEIKNRPAMIQEFIRGSTLYQLQQRQERIDKVGAFIALVHLVAYLHKHAIIHNDIKLENLVLQPSGRLTLLDFGNARRQTEGRGLGLLTRFFKRKRQVFGTASYLAPELITGGQPSYRSDCYAVGVCMHLLLTGEAPFVDARQSQLLRRAVSEQAPSICERAPRLPKELGGIIDACLEKDARRRPESGVALKNHLKGHFESGLHMRPTELNRHLRNKPARGS